MFVQTDSHVQIEDQRGTITVSGASATLIFKLSPAVGELPLNFATAGQSISITLGGTTVFSGTLPTAPAPCRKKDSWSSRGAFGKTSAL